MKTGYSNFVGEFIEASSIGYDDCRDFQIVCPCCSEPVFKSHREGRSATSDFLSHYKSSSSNVSDCEKRVAALRKYHVGRANSEGRGQRLAWFLDVVPDEVEATMPKWLHGLRMTLQDKKAFSEDFREMYRGAVGNLKRANPVRSRQVWNDFNALLEARDPGFARLSPLTKRLRMETALDVERTLYGEASGPAFERIFCHASAVVLNRCLTRIGQGIGDPVDRSLDQFFRIVCTMDRDAALSFIADSLRRRIPVVGATSSVSTGEQLVKRIEAEIHHALSSLDYVAILQARRQEFHDEARIAIEAGTDEMSEATSLGM